MHTINHPYRPISGCSWDSQSSGQSAIMSEVQVNDEEKVLLDVHGTVELGDASKDVQKIT